MSTTKPTVIIVHGWRSSPHRGWIAWLSRELQDHGYPVVAPLMPKPSRPEIGEWIKTIAAAASRSRRLILVGHSMGTYVLLEFIKTLPRRVVVERLVLVAGFYPTESETYWPGYHITEADLVQIRIRVRLSYCIFSNNDRMVEPARSRRLGLALGSELIMLPEQGHFSNLRQATLPAALAAILEPPPEK